MASWRELLHEHIGAALGNDPGKEAQFEQYLALLLKWNSRMNLTAVRQPEEIVRRHFAECIFAAEQIPENVKTLLDFGSGAGLPGIPIALCRPEILVTLAESQGKKVAFLREAVRSLDLHAEIWAGRAEAMAPTRVFDAVTLRAVDRMAGACKSAVERLGARGWLMAFTTERTQSALDDVQGVRWVQTMAVPASEQEILRVGVRI